MALTPNLYLFVPFYELDLSSKCQCISITREHKRCKNFCNKTDRERALVLYRDIQKSSNEAVCRRLLQEFILCICCKAGKHQNRIVDDRLLIPLAKRWYGEIWRNNDNANPVEAIASTTVKTSASSPLPISGLTETIAHDGSPEHPIAPSNENIQPSSIEKGTSRTTTHVASVQNASPGSVTPCTRETRPSNEQTRFNLRPRNRSWELAANRLDSELQPALSEFRPHKQRLRPEDSVSHKLLKCLQGRDFRTGSIYMFDRPSSPGHVKIGWTSGPVCDRLRRLGENCGYLPNLLFKVDGLPHAQRVETLVHYELIGEWRAERHCAGCHTGHKEWFEVSAELAILVVSKWAEFMKRADPYEQNGLLKKRWRDVVGTMMANGEVITAEKLLLRHEVFLAEATLAALSYTMKALECEVKALRHNAANEGVVVDKKLPIPDLEISPQNVALGDQLPAVENVLIKPEVEPASDSLHSRILRPCDIKQEVPIQPMPHTHLPMAAAA